MRESFRLVRSQNDAFTWIDRYDRAARTAKASVLGGAGVQVGDQADDEADAILRFHNVSTGEFPSSMAIVDGLFRAWTTQTCTGDVAADKAEVQGQAQLPPPLLLQEPAMADRSNFIRMPH